MSKIYLVRAFGRQYNDKREHPVKAWTEKSNAEKHVLELEKEETLKVVDHVYDKSFFEFDEIDLN